MNIKIGFLLLTITLVAAYLRLYHLDSLPPALEWDEVATGFDAYSILKTGKDQYGNFLPLTMRSLDDYKPPLYTYMTSASIWVFGWNDFAVRFPAALLGILAVVSTYLLTYELIRSHPVALMAALFLAVSPWHVNFSRLALETNSTIFFTTGGVWAFFRGLKYGPFLILSSVLLGLNLYLYHNARVFVPLLSIILIFLYYKELLTQKRFVLIAALIAGLFSLRLIPILTSVEGQMRFSGTSIFTEAVPLDIYESKQNYANWRTDDTQQNMSFIGRLFHSEKTFFALRLLRNYLAHYDPNFWLFTNDTPRHHVSEMGILYFADLPFIFIGLYWLFQLKNRRAAILQLSWFLLVPIPAAVTRDVPHALRTAIFLPTFQIFVALAIIRLSKIRNTSFKHLILISVSVIYALNVSFFLHQYFVHYAKDTSEYWEYGRKDAALFAESIKADYNQVIVSTSLRHVYAFFLYYLRYDPVKYLNEGGTVSGGWAVEQNKFDKYHFRSFDFRNGKDGSTLFIGRPLDFPPETPVLKKIYFLNGKEAIWIVSG